MDFSFKKFFLILDYFSRLSDGWLSLVDKFKVVGLELLRLLKLLWSVRIVVVDFPKMTHHIQVQEKRRAELCHFGKPVSYKNFRSASCPKGFLSGYMPMLDLSCSLIKNKNPNQSFLWFFCIRHVYHRDIVVTTKIKLEVYFVQLCTEEVLKKKIRESAEVSKWSSLTYQEVYCLF